MLGVDPPEKQNLETISGRRSQQIEEDELISEEENEEKTGDHLFVTEKGSHSDQRGSNQDGAPLVTHGIALQGLKFFIYDPNLTRL